MAYYTKYKKFKFVQPEAKYTVVQAVAAFIYLEEHKQDENLANLTVLDLLDEQLPILPIAQAEQLIEEVQQNLAMKILRGQYLTDFVRKIAKVIKDPNAKINRDFNLLWYLPIVAQRLAEENQLAQATSNSAYQGELGKPITITVEVLECKYIPAYNFFTALLIDADGNVYSFIPKAEVEKGKTITIKGKVKAHKQDKYNNNCKTTYLNYVKILEE